jgi:hypothetical protein
MTPTQAKIEAFEEAKRIIEQNVDASDWGLCVVAWAIEDIDREILMLRKAKPQAPPNKPQDDYRDFSGFGT